MALELNPPVHRTRTINPITLAAYAASALAQRPALQMPRRSWAREIGALLDDPRCSERARAVAAEVRAENRVVTACNALDELLVD